MSKPDTGAAVENEDPAIAEEGAEPDAAAPDAKAPKTDSKTPDNGKKPDDGPPVDSPRWKEVYGKWKDTQRRLEEREKDVDAIREHNARLEARLNQIAETKADRPSEPEPDPAIDPDAYKKWHEMKRLQEKQDWDKQRAMDRHETQVDMQKELHPDYLDMIKIADRDMAKDAKLKSEIWGSPNPAKTAYTYGKTRAKEMEEKDRADQSREVAKKQVETEPNGSGSGEPDEEPEERLSEAEVRVVKNLFPDTKYEEAKKKYIKQKKAMGRS